MTFDPVAVACEVSSAAELETAVLETLAATVGFDVAFFACLGATPTVVGLDATQLVRAFEPGNRYEAELLPVKQAALAARGVAIDTEVLGTSRVRKTAYFRDFAKPLGGKQSLLAYLVLRGRPLGAVMLGRTGASFRSADVMAIETLLPPLTIARASFGLPGHVSRPFAHRGLPPWLGHRRKTARLADTELVVRDRRGFREMVARKRGMAAELVWTRSGLSDPSYSGWPYVELFHLAAALAHRRERALFLGCGGAVAPRQYARVYPGIQIDVVELEPAVVALAQEFFDADEIPGVRFHIADGQAFVAQADASAWDVVVIDAFDSDHVAAGLVDRRFFAALARILRPGGAFAFNLISSLDRSGSVATVLDAARRDFSDLRVVPVMVPDESFAPSDCRNIVVIGTRPR